MKGVFHLELFRRCDKAILKPLQIARTVVFKAHAHEELARLGVVELGRIRDVAIVVSHVVCDRGHDPFG